MKKEKMRQKLRRAMELAKFNHEGQLYAFDKDYYSAHLVRVMIKVRQLMIKEDYSTKEYYELLIIAILHDIIEDTGVTYQQVLDEFGTSVADAVYALTKQKSEPRTTTLARVMRNPKAILVKKGDALVNLETSLKTGNARLINKYLDTLAILTE